MEICYFRALEKIIEVHIMNEDMKKYNEWKEYPERDTRGTIWYPPMLSPLDMDAIWEKRNIGFYVHVPFCKGICKYCPFNRYPWEENAAKLFVNSLKREIDIMSDIGYIKNSTIVAGYFGGGTPTSLSSEQLVDIISHIKDKFSVKENIEISLEANPATIDYEKLSALKQAGITRISLGIQSFNDSILKSMGCSHTASQAITAIETAKKVGFNSLNIDLLYNVPGQTVSDWEQDVLKTLSYDIDHVSPMCLFVDSQSKLFDEYYSSGNTVKQIEELELNMYEIAHNHFVNNGYHMYTLYDYAKPGKECEDHKLNWEAPQGEYFGMGPGAISHINDYVYVNKANPKEYSDIISLDKSPVGFGKKLSIVDQMSRFMVFGFYCLEVHKSEFQKKFGVSVETIFGDTLTKLSIQGLIEDYQGILKLTDKGMKYLYNVSSAFYQEDYKYYPENIKKKIQPKLTNQSS